jgi:FAD/FMN-containing dehydrogenase
LRGGGGNFGVVTRFTFRIHEIGPQVTAGFIAWDAEDAEDVVALFRDVAETAPRELTLALMMRLAPPAPFIPENVQGKPIVALIACHTGNASEAQRDLAPIRAFGKPITDLIVEKPYVEQQSMFNATQPKGMHQYWKSEFLQDLSGDLLESFRQQAARIASPMSQAIVFQLAGGPADYPASATSFANRDAEYVFFAAGCWPPADPDGEKHQAWARSAWEAIRPYSTGGNYINAQTMDEDETRLRAAYRSNLARLAHVKASYDPENLFRVNRNIAPTAQSAPALTSS